MYQDNDLVEGISVKNCFKNLIELAWETKDVQPELADKFFDILVECLGVDFRIAFDIDKSIIPEGASTTNLILNNFRTSSSGVSTLDSLFSNFSYMVHDGEFSNEYLQYLKTRKDVLAELVSYQSLKATQSGNGEEALKYNTLCNDLNLIDRRISLVEANLESKAR